MIPRLVRPLLALLVLAPVSRATWSIVCVNRRTGEVGVASATCLASFNLRQAVPVVVVGEGAAAAQSFIDFSGANKLLIFDSFRETDETPQEILERLAARDGQHQLRQYGIVNFTGAPVTFTGNRDGLAATGVTGEVGDFLYAIQGNVLTGDEVVFAAEAAFRGYKGDMGQKLMAAMDAARALGGDGRCSCAQNDPTGCGVPPPGFTKSAHVGVLIVARMGDSDNGCNANQGCARGRYYLNQNIRSGPAALDPVLQLQSRYKDWRKNLAGRPDAIHSQVAAPASLPIDGTTQRTVEVRLRDVEGAVLDDGQSLVEVRPLGESRSVHLGPVENLGNGRYRFTVTAGTEPGRDTLVITATHTRRDDPTDTITATLFPYVEIDSVGSPLHVGSPSVSTAAGAALPFVTYLPEKPLAAYLLAARIRPPLGGIPWDGGWTLLAVPATPFFPAGPGRLDASGRDETHLGIPAGVLEGWVGARIEVRGFVLDGAPLEVTNRVGFDLVP